MNEDNKPVDLVSWLGFRYPFDFSVAKPLGGFFGASIVLFALALFVALGLSIIMFFSTSFSGDHLGARNYALTLAAILAAPFVVWRAFVGQKLADIAEHGLITDRITKAVEQLGAEKTVWEEEVQVSKPNLEVRLGGIYALERILHDSDNDRVTVLEILCAYIRNNSPASSAAPNPDFGEIKPLPVDIQSILDVIGRRNPKYDEKDYKLDLSDCNLQRANFQGGLFDNAKFSLSYLNFAMLINVKLNGAWMFKTTLNSAWLNEASLNGAWFYEAQLEGVKFKDSQTNFLGVFSTDLSDTIDVTQQQVSSMLGDSATQLPDEIQRPDNWPEDEVEYFVFLNQWCAAKKEAGLP